MRNFPKKVVKAQKFALRLWFCVLSATANNLKAAIRLSVNILNLNERINGTKKVTQLNLSVRPFFFSPPR